MSFKEMTIEYALSNTSARNTVVYKDDSQSVSVSPGQTKIITIKMQDTATFTLTESNNEENPLDVTLIQTSDTSANVESSAENPNWNISSADDSWLCLYMVGSVPKDEILIPMSTEIIDGIIVIVGTVDIIDNPEQLTQTTKN